MSSIGITEVRRARIARPAAFAIVPIFVLAAWLLAAGASGNLWLDEIWSLQNLEPLRHPGEIFWGISQDNNHFLTSLWLWCVGPSAPPLVLRATSMVFALGSIAMAARIAARLAGLPGATIAAGLFATSYAFVHYGSEARGYAGMVFGLLWAVDVLVRLLEEGDDDRLRLQFGCAIAIGSLSHVTMLPAVAVLFCGATMATAGRTRDAVATARFAGRLGSAAVLGAAPVLLAIGAGIVHTNGIRLGDQHAFSLDAWAAGLAGLMRAALGMPDAWSNLAVVGVSFVLALAVLRSVPGPARILLGALIVGLPIAQAVAHLPNQHIPRFHLASAAALLLGLAVVLGQAWTCGGAARRVAFVALCLFALGNAAHFIPFLREGRGDYETAVRLIGRDGFATDLPVETQRVMRFYAHGSSFAPSLMKDDACPPAVWFVAVDDSPTKPIAETERWIGGVSCRRSARIVASFPYAGLSGFRWTLYRIDGE